MCLPLGIRYSIGSSFSFFGLHDDAALVLVVLAELDEAVGFRQHRRFLGLARLEQLRHARQTARDVARLGAFGRNTRQNVAGLHLRAVLHRQNGVDGKRITRLAAARQLHGLALLVDDDDGRTQVGRSWSRCRALSMTTLLVTPVFSSATSLQRDAGDEVLVLHDAVDIGQHRQRVRVPFRQTIAALDGGAFVHLQARAIDDAVASRAPGPFDR